MEILHRGFDGLDVSFAGHITHELCQALENAKQKSQETHQWSALDWNGVRMLVSESGARGGYSFLVSTGHHGATWFFKKPARRDPWGVRVSCSSLNLALNGLGGARADLYRTLEALGISYSGEGESIGRVDFAIDVLAPALILVPDHFVMHSNATRADHIDLNAVSVHGRSGRVSSVTVGKMPGRQVIVYDKREEVLSKGKVIWWEIWNGARALAGRPPLDRSVVAQSRVWRVELRAGKSHLKDRWGIRTWADLDQRCGDMIAAMFTAIRYAQPSADSNRSRWPDDEIWQLAKKAAAEDLFEMCARTDPDLLKHVEREAYDQLLARQMTGLLITRAAVREIQDCGLPEFAIRTGQELARHIESRFSHFERRLSIARSRFDLGLKK